jgi:hypothetical protein
MGEISAVGCPNSSKVPLVLSSVLSHSLVLSPHGRFRLSLVRHAEENKVTAKLDAASSVVTVLGEI